MSRKLLTLLLMCTINADAADKNNTLHESGDMHIIVTQFKSNKGLARITLVNNKDSYLSSKVKPFQLIESVIENNKVEVVFKSVPFGLYGITIYHDENSNGKLDRYFYGKPKEDTGFSNNAKGKLGPPKYKDIEFEFSKDSGQVQIKL